VVTSCGEDAAAATISRTRFLHAAVGEQLDVKAAGVLTDLAHVVDAVEAGASRISTSFSADLAASVTAWLRDPASAATAPLADIAAAAR